MVVDELRRSFTLTIPLQTPHTTDTLVNALLLLKRTIKRSLLHLTQVNLKSLKIAGFVEGPSQKNFYSYPMEATDMESDELSLFKVEQNQNFRNDALPSYEGGQRVLVPDSQPTVRNSWQSWFWSRLGGSEHHARTRRWALPVQPVQVQPSGQGWANFLFFVF